MSDSRDPADEEPKAKPVVHQAASPSPQRFPFDEVLVAESAGTRRLTPDEFFALPLAQRIQFVVQQRASFFASGQPVDSKEVLGQMRKIRAQLH